VAVTTSRHPPLYLLALPTLSQRLVLGNDERFVRQPLAPTASDYSLPVLRCCLRKDTRGSYKKKVAPTFGTTSFRLALIVVAQTTIQELKR